VELEYFGVLPSYSTSHADFKTLQAVLLINLCAYLAIAYLAGRLSAKLRAVDVQLQDTHDTLQNLQALHENVIRSMSGGLLTTDLEGRITLANRASQRLLEQSEKDLLGQQVARLFLDRLPALAAPAPRGEVRYRTPSGSEKTFSMAVSELNVSDRGSLGWIYNFDDLTELRRLEREVRQRDRLAAVGRLAAAIAHEIRNPLSSISGSVNVLSGISALNDEQRQLVEIVTRESERLNNIISDFLSYARDKQYQFSSQDLVRLLEDTLTLLENSTPADGTRIQIVRKFEIEKAPAFVDGDKIKQVFWNICSNAVRAMSSGGTLTVSARAAGPDWLISFADTGSGLSQQQLEKMFEPFQSEFRGGSGLGMAIVYQIVQAHAGKILVRSVQEQGTVVSMHLNRAATKPDAFAGVARQQQKMPVAKASQERRASSAVAGGGLNHG
jgi:two-component system sensor histidine kinase PilS (NtrC family)